MDFANPFGGVDDYDAQIKAEGQAREEELNRLRRKQERKVFGDQAYWKEDDREFLESWGWRIPFLVAIPLLLVAVYISSRLEESPVFRQLEESGEVEKSPISTTLKRSWKQIIVGMAAALLGVGGFYLVCRLLLD